MTCAACGGDNIWVNTDVLLTHDVCGPGTIGVFKREFGKTAKVWDKNKIVIIPDHYIFTADSLSNRNVDILRAFVQEQGLPYFYDVIDDPNGHWIFDASRGQLKKQFGSRYAGVCHTALPAKGHTRPGEILFGTDSHTCMAGAFNMFATGIGNTDAGFIMGTGKLLIKVPRDDALLPRRQAAQGRHGQGRRAARHRRDRLRRRDLSRDAVRGPGAMALNMDDRMTIANMAIEAGGKNGVFPADEKTFAYVDERTKRNGTKSDYTPVERRQGPELRLRRRGRSLQAGADRRAASRSGPSRAGQGLGNIQLDRAYIGSCTGGKTSDFLAFAACSRAAA
jgi:3-isopropylmalate/(R)-2-methylmalate dehydratase large subunit